ncbi:unnamed protein product [Eretmochelys imbricata]
MFSPSGAGLLPVGRRLLGSLCVSILSMLARRKEILVNLETWDGWEQGGWRWRRTRTLGTIGRSWFLLRPLELAVELTPGLHFAQLRGGSSVPVDSKPGSTGWIEDVEERRGAASAPDGRNSSLESCHLLLVRLLCASVPGCLLTEVAGSQHENVVMTDGLFTAFHPCSGLHRMLVLVCKRHFWVWSLALPHCPFALSTHLLLTPSFLPTSSARCCYHLWF